MIIKKYLLLILILLVYSSHSQEHLYSSLTIPEHLTQGANAVVRLNEMEVVINSQNSLTINQKRIVTVLNEKGDYAVRAGSGYNKYFRVKKIQATIFDQSGNQIKKIKERDFIDHSAVDGGTLYSDSRVLFMGYTPISYPYTVEFLCEIGTSNTAALPTWRPLDDYYLSVQKDVYSLVDNAGLGLRFKEKNLEDYHIKKQNTQNSLNYILEDTQTIKSEELSPSFSKLSPEVLIAVENFHFFGVDGKAKNWLEFGNWIEHSLLVGRDGVTDETKDKIKNLTQDLSDPIEKAKKVFEFVQSNTRYISVQVGIGGVQPISALDVDKLKYGDCKGLTNYTKALLNVAGVPSYYCVVEAGRDIVDFEPDFASLAQGNHIILAIPNNDKELLWLDCTSQVHPFNFIGDFTDNRNVLVVKPESSEIIKTKKYADSLNQQSIKAHVLFNEDRSISSNVEITTKGIQYDNRFHLERQSDKDIIEYYKEHWGYVNNLEVLNYSFNNDKTNVEFVENIEVQARDYGHANGDRYIFSLNIFNKNTYVPNRYRSRKLPFEIQRGYLDTDEFKIQIPKGYKIEAMPKVTSLKNKFGEYNFEVSASENEVTIKRKLFIKKGNYLKTEYAAYRDFRKQVSKGDNSKIVLIKSTKS